MTDSPSAIHSWDTYWRGASHVATFSSGGTSHPAVLSFWDEVFGNTDMHGNASRIVDIASGSGAVIESAKSAWGGQLPNFTCVDISESAVHTLQRRFPSIHALVADARNIPLQTGKFDMATSQFGVEYAGPKAMDELIRLVGPSGRIALLLHHRDGGIYRQCAASLDAIERTIAAEFVPRAITMFKAGFELYRGGERDPFEVASRHFVPAIHSMESIMTQHGQHVTDGTILRLYRDVRSIHERMQNYDAAEVLGWLERMQDELHAYAGRMESMCSSALDGSAFSALGEKLTANGYKLMRNEALLVPESNTALAWALIASRT